MNKDGEMTTILIVDDDPSVRRSIAAYLEDSGFFPLMAANGKEGLEVFASENPGAVLVDIRMPEMGGLEFIDRLAPENKEIPFIGMSGAGSVTDTIEAVRRGAWDYISKPIVDMAVLEHVLNRALERARLLRDNRRYKELLEEEVKERTAELEIRNLDLIDLNSRLAQEVVERTRAEQAMVKLLNNQERIFEGTIQSISRIVEIRDPYTAGHQQRVALLAQTIARELGYSEEKQTFIYIAGMLHDIGKIAVPTEILAKPGILYDYELGFIRMHPEVGFSILKTIEFPWPLAEVIYQHHERINGSGYPLGLSGDQILPESKVLSVADVVEAMASHRPYRPALGNERALDEISRNKNILYDGDAVDVCLHLFQDKNFAF